MMRKNSLNITEPNWSNPIHIDSFEEDTIGELFGETGISFDKVVSKRKGDFDNTPSTKKSKSKHGPLAKVESLNIINDDNELLMNEAEIQALSDSFSSDSFDEESGDDDLLSLNDEEGEYDLGDETDKKSRGNYACSKCGLPKRGHVCVFQPRSRRRGGMIGSVEMSEASAQRRLRIAQESEGMPMSAKFMVNGPVMRCDAQVGSDGAVGPIAWEASATERPAGPEMVSTGTQCSLDTAGTVRELYLDAQGFPESYANGIIADPSFDVRTARTITVSRPAPKSYKPKVTTSCSGSGPDSTSLTHCPTPLMIPPFVAPTQNRTLPNNRAMDLGANFLQGMQGMQTGLPLGNGLVGLGGLGGLGNLGALNSNPLLNMNHLALLMNSYQLQNQSTDEPIDPALASLFFPSSF